MLVRLTPQEVVASASLALSLPQLAECTCTVWWLQLETAQAAWEQGIPLNHDILRRVGQCSASPADAASFFMAMLWPKAEDRFVPSHLHVYLRKTYDSLTCLAYGGSLEDRVQLAGRGGSSV